MCVPVGDGWIIVNGHRSHLPPHIHQPRFHLPHIHQPPLATRASAITTTTIILHHRELPQGREVDDPSAASTSSSEEDPPGRCVPGAIPLECPLASPRFTAQLRFSTARGTMCQRRGADGPVELLAQLSKASPSAAARAGRRNPRLALDEEAPAPAASCANVGDGRRGESGCVGSAGGRGGQVRPHPVPHNHVAGVAAGPSMAPNHAPGTYVVVEEPRVPAQRRRPLRRPRAPLPRPCTGLERPVRQESRPGAVPPPAWPVQAKHQKARHQSEHQGLGRPVQALVHGDAVHRDGNQPGSLRTDEDHGCCGCGGTARPHHGGDDGSDDVNRRHEQGAGTRTEVHEASLTFPFLPVSILSQRLSSA
ncbi:hypothetical protein D1007_43241 [Hordeum vulgare]|nr:hypothetical protein D1007_43241 [Hordeum vulgare]